MTVPSTIVVTVEDDSPTASQALVTGTVDEDGLAGGIAGGPGAVSGTATVASGSVAALFNSGADTPLSYSLLSGTGGLPALTSGGAEVTYAVVGDTLTASAGGEAVFTFALAADGSYTFTPPSSNPSPDPQRRGRRRQRKRDLSIALGFADPGPVAARRQRDRQRRWAGHHDRRATRPMRRTTAPP